MIEVPIVKSDWFICDVAVVDEKCRLAKPDVENIGGYIDVVRYRLEEGVYWVVYLKCEFDLFDKVIKKYVGVRKMRVWRDGSSEILSLWYGEPEELANRGIPDCVMDIVWDIW